jgi:hypothetical protein
LIEKGGFWKLPKPSRRELRNFCLVMAIGLAIFGLLAWYKESVPATNALGICSALFLLAALVYPPVTRPLFAVWMILARILGYINTHILLALVFYTMFTVIGLTMRLFGRDPMDRTLQTDRDSYWHRRPTPLLPHDHFERQF